MLNEEYNAEWDYDVLVFIPKSMPWEDAFQATKHIRRESKTAHLTNPNHWDKEHLKNPNFFTDGCYIWRMTFSLHKLPDGYRYLTEGEVIEATDIYWSVCNFWRPAYAVGRHWGQGGSENWAIYARKIS